jgi:hypothetical protein
VSIFEAIGMAWVIFTSAIATVGILYLAYFALRSVLRRPAKDGNRVKGPIELKEMFKIVR